MVLALLLSLAPAAPQFDPRAPEPIGPLEGELVLSSAAGPGAQARAHLAGRLGPEGEEAWDRLVVWAGGPVEGPWYGNQGARRVEAAAPSSAVRQALADSLEAARVLWVEGGSGAWMRELLNDDALRAALGDWFARGGTLGAAGELAEVLDARGLDLFVGWHLSADGSGQALAGHPMALPGPGATLVAGGRRMRALDAAVRVELAASSRRAALSRSLSPDGGPVDTVALSRAARARAGEPFPSAEVVAPTGPAGHLVLVGGGGLPPGTLERFIDLAGGPEAPVVYVPCRQEPVLEREPGMVRSLRAAGARNVTWIHTKDRARADGDRSLLEPLEQAGGVWFGGGRQWNLVDSYQHTEVHRLFHGVLERGGVIGGSSAGASIQASYLARGDPLGNTNIIAEGYERGLGFLRGCAVDQHFSERGRHRDLLSLKQAFPQLLGIGIDESTALWVQGDRGEVRGAGRVFFFDGSEAPEDLEGAATAVGDGGLYDLVERRRVER